MQICHHRHSTALANIDNLDIIETSGSPIQHAMLLSIVENDPLTCHTPSLATLFAIPREAAYQNS
eukprot:14095545-Ditylum_brightwellii.AAC.1